MARTITIPNNMKPKWECEINGINYSYPSGTEQTVPDSVAALIDANENMKPVQDEDPDVPAMKSYVDDSIGGALDGTY